LVIGLVIIDKILKSIEFELGLLHLS
jgi:hypothetical protein